MGLAFFKLSIGMGCMMTYGSYFRDDQHIPLTTVRVMCADLFVSMLAGIAIFPAVFAFGFEPSAGPPCCSSPYPRCLPAFRSVTFSWCCSSCSPPSRPRGHALHPGGAGLRALRAFSHEPQKGHPDQPLGAGAVGSTCALSNSTLADVQIAGKTFFDLFDFVSSNVLMPLGGIFLCLFVGWVWGFERMKTALTNGGELELPILKPCSSSSVTCRPLLILIVMLRGLGLF